MLRKKCYTILAIVFIGCTKSDLEINSTESGSTVLVPDFELTENVIEFNSETVCYNYTLSVYNAGNKVQLIDKGGNEIYAWNFEEQLGNDFELLDDGRALAIFKSETVSFGFGGYGGVIKLINPDNTIFWEYHVNSENEICHHDVEMLPNGNILCMVWYKISSLIAQSMGVNTNEAIYVEKIIEINPSSNAIVWQWNSMDHIVQDYNPDASNFGAIDEHPNKININYNLQDDGDRMHANGITYDSDKDVIFLSVNFYNEIWVIDHSTSTEEAATSSGGQYNKGGDLIYRFGNPSAYGNSNGERIFYRNHFPNLIKKGLPGHDNMLVYINFGENNEPQSSVVELKFPESFELHSNQNNEPTVVWEFTDTEIFSRIISGADRLSNGNTLIAEGDFGIWEVNHEGEVVWKYQMPIDPISGNISKIWRAYGYEIGSEAVTALDL